MEKTLVKAFKKLKVYCKLWRPSGLWFLWFAIILEHSTSTYLHQVTSLHQSNWVESVWKFFNGKLISSNAMHQGSNTLMQCSSIL